MTRIIPALSDVSHGYDAMFVDLWGCLHNGIHALPEAVAALQQYRGRGGVVILVTNSPKPRLGVETQIRDQFGVPDDCWDAIATSGDSARVAMYTGTIGQKVWFMGDPDRDAGFFEPPQLLTDPKPIERVALEEADGIACCGPFDPMADPSHMRPQFLLAKTKGMKLLCANPDIVVDRGEQREWCAGALAQLYTEMGGESLYFGKPHPPIYDLARRRLLALGHEIPTDRILAVGDGIQTDIAGAQGEDLDSLFVTGGLAAGDTRTDAQPDRDALDAFLAREQRQPTFAIGQLR